MVEFDPWLALRIIRLNKIGLLIERKFIKPLFNNKKTKNWFLYLSRVLINLKLD